ncbi:MAG: hypothetical protein ACTSXG_03340 [Alphaproteobacteria bacterium]
MLRRDNLNNIDIVIMTGEKFIQTTGQLTEQQLQQLGQNHPTPATFMSIQQH